MAYLKSSLVNVFPAGFRGQQYITGKTLSEQAMISLRSFSNYTMNQNFFVEDPADATMTIIGIGGYFFKVAKTNIPEATGALYAYIRLRLVGNIGYVLDNINRDILSQTTTDSEYTLDQEVSSQGQTFYEFQGLQFTPTPISPSATLKQVLVRKSDGTFNFTSLRLNAKEVRDQYYTTQGNVTVWTEKSIDEEFHTDHAVVDVLEANQFNPSAVTVGTLVATTLNGRTVENIFETNSIKVKLATLTDNLNKTSVGMLILKSTTAGDPPVTTYSTDVLGGTGFIKLTAGVPTVGSLIATDIPTITEAQVSELNTHLNLKLNSSNGSGSNITIANLTANGLTTSGTMSIDGVFKSNSSSMSGTSLPASGTLGLIFFLIQE